jgi:outer membrane protein
MRCSVLLLGAMTAIASAQPKLPAPVELAEPGTITLTMARAVELAMTQQASLRQVRANSEAAAGRVELARVPLRPSAQLAASVSAGSSLVRPCASTPDQTCGGFFDPSTSTGVSAQVNWRLYDFGQSAAAIRSAQANAAAGLAGVDTSELDVRADVEVSYLEAVARQHLLLVAQATLSSEEAHLDQSRRFVAAQARDPIEVALAQARAASAKSALAQAESNFAVALANLRAAIGWLDPTRQVITEPSWPQPSAQSPPMLIELVRAAQARRPEIAQLDKLILAAEASVEAAAAERRPVLSAAASTQWTPDSSDWAPQPSWTAGVTLSWQVWDGGRSAANVRIARANLLAARAQRDLLLVGLTSVLEATRARIIASTANVQASTEAVTAAQAALKLAEARYAQGLGSQIELADAQTAVTTAQGTLVTAEWQLAEAWTQLRRATGVM